MPDSVADTAVRRDEQDPGLVHGSLTERWSVRGPNGGHLASPALPAGLARGRFGRLAGFHAHLHERAGDGIACTPSRLWTEDGRLLASGSSSHIWRRSRGDERDLERARAGPRGARGMTGSDAVRAFGVRA